MKEFDRDRLITKGVNTLVEIKEQLKTANTIACLTEIYKCGELDTDEYAACLHDIAKEVNGIIDENKVEEEVKGDVKNDF